jgi:hypothetical protein
MFTIDEIRDALVSRVPVMDDSWVTFFSNAIFNDEPAQLMLDASWFASASDDFFWFEFAWGKDTDFFTSCMNRFMRDDRMFLSLPMTLVRREWCKTCRSSQQLLRD